MRGIFFGFLSLYILAVALFMIGTYGLFGLSTRPLAEAFLLPLGLPWNLVAERLGVTGGTSLLLAPIANLVILLTLRPR